MAYEALRSLHDRATDLPIRLERRRHRLRRSDRTTSIPAETLFIVASKTFTTLETMTNARTARAWLLAALGDEAAVAKHFVAVSTNAAEVAKFGIDTENMFGFWDWVGGRYSMESAIGLSTMIAIGPEHFRAMLAGVARDGRALPHRAVRAEPPGAARAARPLVRDFFGAETVAVLPYEQYLDALPGVSPAAHDGEQRQARHARRRASRLRDRGGLLGRAGHERPALVLPADPPGHAADPVRLHRLLPDARTRSATTTTC